MVTGKFFGTVRIARVTPLVIWQRRPMMTPGQVPMLVLVWVSSPITAPNRVVPERYRPSAVRMISSRWVLRMSVVVLIAATVTLADGRTDGRARAPRIERLTPIRCPRTVSSPADVAVTSQLKPIWAPARRTLPLRTVVNSWTLTSGPMITSSPVIAVGWMHAEGWMRRSSPRATRASRWRPFRWARNSAGWRPVQSP
ncbi:hypothetical protein ACIRP0_23490 [Streptomyces sp. NPDC101733]|uniref:hypothetical protein n=1 Tax=Streptomyces sp. NPDC101733 TaxID=3366144 RepID=UPI0037F2CF5C